MGMSTSRRASAVAGPFQRVVRGAVLGVLVVLVTVGLRPPAADAATSGVTFSATVNGQPALTSSDAHPAELYPARFAQVRITVTNNSRSMVRVSSVRLEGQVVALPLFSYNSAVALAVGPGRTDSLTFPISLSGVGSQATGLVVATITLLGPNGAEIASQALVTNVHGSLHSLYGLFGLAVLILTASSLAIALLAMARHTLPQNRWLRGTRFLIPGFGIGLILTFTLSALDVFTAGPGHWLPLLVVCSVAGFAVGYLTPAPNEEDVDDYDDDVLLAQILVVDDDPLEADETTPASELASRPTASPTAPDSRATAAP
jgi:hypothetical protein